MHFFTPKVDGQERICISCRLVSPLAMELNFLMSWQILFSIREKHNALEDKTQWPNNRNYKYSWRTATSGLRSHLNRFHKEEYLLLSKEKGWVIQLASVKNQLQMEQEKSASNLSVKNRIVFSSDAVTEHLVCFIAANDQVRFSGVFKFDLIINDLSTIVCQRCWKQALQRTLIAFLGWLSWWWYPSQNSYMSSNYGIMGKVF